MQYFNFERLINKYMSEFDVITFSAGGYNDMGDYVKSEPVTKKLKGAIISSRDNKNIRTDGTLTSSDKQLFMLEPIENALIGAEIIYKDNKYKIEDCTENAEFTGVWVYTMRYVSAFDKGAVK